jgi:predicted extracellular nuclease
MVEKSGCIIGNVPKIILIRLALVLGLFNPLLVAAQDRALAVGLCGDKATLISAIQATGSASPLIGQSHVIEGVVIGDYQETAATQPSRPELQGFFVQEDDADNDADAATSEGIFVFDPAKTLDVAEGDRVRVAGKVSEAFGTTQLEQLSHLQICANGQSVTPATVDLPVPMSFATIDDFWERYEGMLLSFADVMTVTGQHELARYGQLLLSAGGVLREYGQDAALPLNAPDHGAWLTSHARRSIRLDDYNSQQNLDPVYHPQPGGFASDNPVRTGATLALRAVLEKRFDVWLLQPQKSAPPIFTNPPQPVAPPALNGNLRLAVLNVLNYFNGDGLGAGFPTSRGADSQLELDRQTDKIIAAIIGLNADVLGLMEIENDGDGTNDALEYLVAAVNASAGANTYDHVPAGANGGSDEIKVALIYKPVVVAPAGAAQLLADAAFIDPANLGTQQNRPALAQTFRVIDKSNPDFGSVFTAVVLHLKSKGSACAAGDDDVIQGNCNGTRTQAAITLLDWLATDPTGTFTHTGAVNRDVFILGDLNAYYQEDPMQVLYNAGYTNLIAQSAASFEFDGNHGSLDHILASASLSEKMRAGGIWEINAGENSLLDYNDSTQDSGEQPFEAKPASNPLYTEGPYRSSDHNPVLAAVSLANAPVVAAPVPPDQAGCGADD